MIYQQGLRMAFLYLQNPQKSTNFSHLKKYFEKKNKLIIFENFMNQFIEHINNFSYPVSTQNRVFGANKFQIIIFNCITDVIHTNGLEALTRPPSILTQSLQDIQTSLKWTTANCQTQKYYIYLRHYWCFCKGHYFTFERKRSDQPVCHPIARDRRDLIY